jgi:vacuolar iron transporter family protein
MPISNKERHRTGRIGWLRAAVLGANDGLLSTSSLARGVAAAHATHGNVLVAGVAGLVAGSMSMADGEYVSVHSQVDTERAELNLERAELKSDKRVSIKNWRPSTSLADSILRSQNGSPSS